MIGHPFDGIGRFFIQAAYFCTSDYARDNRDTVERFARAIEESSAYVNAHHAETADLIAKFTSLEPAQVAKMTRVEQGTSLDPKLVQPVIDAMLKYKTLAQPIDARDIMFSG